MKYLGSQAWWIAAGKRAARTALVVAIPYVPVSYLGHVPYVTILSAAVLAAILSLLTSLVGLPEVEGKQSPWWFAIVERVVKTVAQAAITAVGNVVLFQDVRWIDVGQVALTAGFGSLLLAFLRDLPESEKPLAQASSTIIKANSDGVPTAQKVPVVEPVQAPPVPENIPVLPPLAKPPTPAPVPAAAVVPPSEPPTKESKYDPPFQ